MSHWRDFAWGFEAPFWTAINAASPLILFWPHDLTSRSFSSHELQHFVSIFSCLFDLSLLELLHDKKESKKEISPLQNGDGKSHCAPLPGDTIHVRILCPSNTKPDSQLYRILSPMLYREPWMTPFEIRPGVPHVWLGRTETHRENRWLGFHIKLL